MPTYAFAEKNGNANVTLSADNEEEALAYFSEIVCFPKNWRMEVIDNED